MKRTIILEIESWNKELDVFYNETLAEKLGKKPTDKFSMHDWFKAQEIIREQNFYKIASEIQKKYRDMGYDVKNEYAELQIELLKVR